MRIKNKRKKKISKEVIGHKTVFDTPYSREKLEAILQASDSAFEAEIEEGVMTTQEKREYFYIEIPGGKKFEVYDRDEYLEGTYDELVAAGKGGISLYELRRQKTGTSLPAPKKSNYIPPREVESIDEPSPYTVKHYSSPPGEVITSSDISPKTIPDNKNFNRPKPESEE